MSNTCQVKSETRNRKKTGWDEAIKDARLKIAALRNTIEIYQARRDAGDPWPGQSEGRGSRQQHSV
jgi:hypothetical protein